MHLMFIGSRPPRPDRGEVSDAVWNIIQCCWDPVGPRRIEIDEVVTLLEAELHDVAALGV